MRITPRAAVIAVAALLCLQAQNVNAGFLEMPDTTEVPEMERESMLKDLDIPSVRERDPDPTAGPRLNITEFRVQGIVEYPELGITRKALTKLVEGIRFDMMGEGEMLESGYTLEEMSEISDLVAEIEEETQGDSVGPLDVQRLVFLIRDQRQRRGVTLGMIEAVADTITRYYRERGFILAKAYIPEQRVRDGVVTLTLLLGNLGEVEVHNNKKYSKETIVDIFKPSLNKPVKSDLIEEKLFFVNDLPGLTAQAFFEPGEQVGDTKLSVNVRDEETYSSNVRLDNHGSSSTGEYRIYGDFQIANLAGVGDQLHFGLLATVSPSNSIYGSVHYGLPLLHQRAKWSIGGSTNDFVSNSIGGLELTGTSLVLDTSFNYILKRSRAKNYSAEFRLMQIKTDIENNFNNTTTESEELTEDQRTNQTLASAALDTQTRNYDFLYNFDVLLEKWRALHQGGVRLSGSQILNDPGANQKEFTPILAANYTFLKFLKIPFTDINTRVVLKAAGQYASTSVASTSQFSLGGPNKMRALAVNQYNADTGLYLASDWVFNTPQFMDWEIAGVKFNDIVQPYVFFELAYGDITPPVAGEGTWAYATDLGFGLKMSYRNVFRAGLSYATVLDYTSDIGTPVKLNANSLEEKSKLYFEMQYSF